jgi:hypothetical protein
VSQRWIVNIIINALANQRVIEQFPNGFADAVGRSSGSGRIVDVDKFAQAN